MFNPGTFRWPVLLGILLSSMRTTLLPAEELIAIVRRPSHPVLMRNVEDPVLKIGIELPEQRDISVKSFRFSLKGTTDLRDISSLQLYSTADREDFSPDTEPVDLLIPDNTIEFGCELPLKTGRNFFWLAVTLNPKASLSGRVVAGCLGIDTTHGELPLREEPSCAFQRVGIALRRHLDEGVHTYRIPALTRSKKNSLLCVYDMRRRSARDLQEDIDIGLSRSTDAGQTWESPRIIMDMGEFGGLPQEQNGCSDPGIIVDQQTGEIFCFAVWMNGKPGKHQWTEDGSEPGYEIGKSAQIMMVKSSDDGLTWTKPINMTRDLKQESWWLFAPAPQSGFALDDGTLVMPVQGRNETGETFASIMISSNHGLNWKVGNPAFRRGNECQAALLEDGVIMLNIRNDNERFRGVMTSRDLGKSWQEHPSNRKLLIEPNCNASLLRFDYQEASRLKHLLLFANPHTQKGRTHHTLQVSLDDGLSWPESHHLLLDEGRGAGYPSMTQIDDRHLGIVYEGSRANLVFERISLDELLTH